jgi:hypothetical protein
MKWVRYFPSLIITSILVTLFASTYSLAINQDSKWEPPQRELTNNRLEEKIAYLTSLQNSPGNRSNLALSSAYQVVGTSANVHGAFGSWFKTKVTLMNPTNYTYQLYCTLYSNQGRVASRYLTLYPMQSLTWDNFLDEAFQFTGAGALEFDSWFDPPSGSSDYDFIVLSETYNDSPNGRYSTVVMHGAEVDTIGSTYPCYNLGISVNSSQRTNIGVWNRGALPSTVWADVYDASGILLTTVTLNVIGEAWYQVPLQIPVTNGYIRWRTNGLLVYPYAVVVDNKSNDGTFAPSTTHVTGS